MSDSKTDSHEQFTRLVVANQRRLYGFVYTLINDHAATDDLLQEVTTLLWQKFDTFESGTDFGAWAMKVARFKVLEWRREQAQNALPIEDELLLELAAKAEVHQQTEGLGRLEALESCLGMLNSSDRMLIKQRYSDSQSVVNIAKQKGRTRDAVYKVLARIHRNLQACIDKKLTKEFTEMS